MKAFNEDKTNYKKIYERTYWGGFFYNNDQKEIIQNRNKFIPEFNIKRIQTDIRYTLEYKQQFRLLYKEYYDHIEIYRTQDNKILMLVSPYNHKKELSEEEFLHKSNFKKIYNLYHTHADSYYKIIKY